MVNLITEHIDIWTTAQTQKNNGGRGRGKNSNGRSPHGIKKLRELILELAVRGKLVPQDPTDLPAPQSGKFFVYALECEDKSIYIGQTDDILKRWKEHAAGKGADWTKKHSPLRLVHWEEYDSRAEAIKREKELKTGFGRKWIKRELAAGRTRQAGEPASVLLKNIAKEKKRIIKAGKIKKQKPLPEISEDEKPFKLPEGWEWERLGNIAEIIRGVTYKKHNVQGYDFEGSIALMRANNIGYTLNLDNLVYIPKSLVKEKQIIISGDLLIAMSSGSADLVGKAAQINSGIDSTFGAFCGVIRAITADLWNYFGFFFKTPIYRNQATTSGKGIGINNLSKGSLESLLIALPPLIEQQHIVAKVDELMALCDQLEQQQTVSNATHQALLETLLATLTNAADQREFARSWQRIANHFDTLFTTEQSIDQLKQAILQFAVMGKLVIQDSNNEPASVMLGKIAQKKVQLIKEGKIKKQIKLPEINENEKPFELPQGWAWSRLQEAIDVRDGTHDSPKDAIGPDTFPLVTSKNFYNSSIKFDEARRISAEDHFNISKRSFVDRYDILFSMIGGNLGNQVIVDDDRPFSVKNVALFKYYDRELTSPFFIKKFMEHLALDLQSKAAGGAQPFVSLGFLRKLVIAIPPIEEQHRIVAKVDELMALCDTLKARLNDAQTTQVQLADAIVKQAVA